MGNWPHRVRQQKDSKAVYLFVLQGWGGVGGTEAWSHPFGFLSH